MHKQIIKIILAVLTFYFPTNSAQTFKPSFLPAETGSVTVRITGFENDKGECWFALDNSEEVYESEDSVFIGRILPIIKNEVIIQIDSLEFGIYAIRVFHDENSNGELDSNFLGIPTEDYGYSNNVSAWFGPPSWERAKFLIDKEIMTLEISVN